MTSIPKSGSGDTSTTKSKATTITTTTTTATTKDEKENVHKNGVEKKTIVTQSVARGDHQKEYRNPHQYVDRRSTAQSQRKSLTQTSSKQRSKSTTEGTTYGDGKNTESKHRYNSINKTRAKHSTNSINSDGYVFDGENFDLDEPFSDTDDETPRGSKKMTMVIPHGRIRTLSGTVPAVGYSPKWGGPTMCLSCLQFFDLPEMVVAFSEHLLKEHHIVVVEMDLIVDPKRYAEYWRQRFAKESIDKIFPKVVPKEDSPYYGKVDYYYEMSEKLSEDYALRQKLAMRRLEEALACQQREREDTNFTQQCIFCRYTARGNRAKIIHHLYMIHHLNLGSPDNLVFVTEYIEHLKAKFARNECIYCEKDFADRTVLMDHMRKRNHKEVNPKNSYYDTFYIINYLELGKRWLDVLAEDFEDTMPTFVDSDEEEEEESWQEWQEDNIDVEQTRVVCLFCEDTYDSAAPLLEHIKTTHHLDILGIIEKEQMDIYDRVKMINYIRKENYNARCFVCGKSDLGSLQGLRQHYVADDHLSKGLPEKAVWCIEENLVPIFANDHLTWMLESHIDENTSNVKSAPEDKKDFREFLLKESEANTVTGVIAEDFPELRDGALANKDLYESLK